MRDGSDEYGRTPRAVSDRELRAGEGPTACESEDPAIDDEHDLPATGATDVGSENNELSAVNAQLRSKVTELKRTQLELETALDRLERAVARRSAVIVLLRRLAEAANSAGSVEDALAVIVPDLAMHLGVRYGQTWLIDEQDPESVVAAGPFFEAAAGAASPMVETTPARRAVAESQLAAEVMERRRPLWSVDLEAALGPERGAAARGAGLQLVMVLPVLTQDRSAGYLELLLERADERREYVVELATSVGIEIGRVLERVAMQRKLSDLSDEEQRRLGKELHDTVAQEIAGIRMLAEVLQQHIEDGAPDAATVAHLVDAARQAQGHVRSLARGLVPATIAAGGLRAAVMQLAERMEAEHGLACEFQNDDDIVIEESRTATNLYYIAQEALNNAVHHGKAQRVTVSLERADGVLYLRIEDDGCGFGADRQSTRTGSGLRIMEYRARLIGGSLTVDSGPGSGATVTCRLAGGSWTAGSETADSP
jgi:signal transduction histidine kinase